MRWSRARRSALGAKAKLTYRRNYPVLSNHPKETDFAASIAKEMAGDAQVDTDLPPMMGAEDFSFMLNAKPGAFIWIGNGDSAGLHHPAYNFNDDGDPVRDVVLGQAGGKGAAGLTRVTEPVRAARVGGRTAPTAGTLATAARCGSNSASLASSARQVANSLSRVRSTTASPTAAMNGTLWISSTTAKILISRISLMLVCTSTMAPRINKAGENSLP